MLQSEKITEIKNALQSTLEGSIKAGVPSLSAAICTSEGVLWQSSLGTGTDFYIPTLYGIGSITKVFVAVVIFQLVEEKRLNISDTLGDILDEEITHGIANAKEATIGGLLSHTAGVESWEDDPKWIAEARGEAMDPEKIWSKTETLDYIRRPNSLGPKPGEWSYSNTDFQLLGLVIEVITKNTAEAEIRKRILDPLGMKYTYIENFEDPQPEKLPDRYHWATESFQKTAGICPRFLPPKAGLIDVTGSNLSVEWVTGGMISCPSDMLAFAIALRDGKLLASSSMDIMTAWRPAKGPAEMGHGLFRFNLPSERGSWLGHFGSVLGFTGGMLWVEKGDCAVCVLSNVGTMHAGDVPSSAPKVLLETEFLKLASELAAYNESLE
jgi:D-alanyl-D-alanine carboxypeptidase